MVTPGWLDGPPPANSTNERAPEPEFGGTWTFT
jgi:hypothetical protein